MVRARSGQRLAEEALFTRHVGRVLALCLRLLGDRDEAEDVLQEAFLEGFAELDQLRDPQRFASWLTGITVHKAEGRFRRRRTRRFVLARSLAAEGLTFLRARPELPEEQHALLTQLDAMLAGMRDRDRACWLLCNVDGYTLEEVAELLHRPAAIVRRRLARAERVVSSLVGASARSDREPMRDLPLPSPQARLPIPLAPLLDERRPANARELLRASQARRALRGKPMRGSRALRVAAGLALALLIILLGVGVGSRHEPVPLSLRDERNLPSAMLTELRYHAFDLSDGSRITLASGARVDVLENSARELVLALRQGRARFDVQHDPERSWRIESGHLSVEGMGSKFVIERGARAVRITVEQGSVLVRGDLVRDGVQRLTQGHTLVTQQPADDKSSPNHGTTSR